MSQSNMLRYRAGLHVSYPPLVFVTMVFPDWPISFTNGLWGNVEGYSQVTEMIGLNSGVLCDEIGLSVLSGIRGAKLDARHP